VAAAFPAPGSVREALGLDRIALVGITVIGQLRDLLLGLVAILVLIGLIG
jgi:hypothetical protein